ncbi:hypothetical protein AMJ86_09180 [bacterium SM23_57]|nr:MAG: hypothetical protein AMJ86_09180 [bacterium SM23_57]
MKFRYLIGIVGVGLLMGIASVLAETYVSGEVFGTWNASGNPYIVEGDLSIPFDKTLRINAGVVVYFQGNDSLSVYGRLIVGGTYHDPVLFAPDAENFDGWKGVFFKRNAMNDSEIEYASISGSFIGIDVDRCDVDVRYSDINVVYRGLVLIEADGNYLSNTIQCHYLLVTGIYLLKSNAKLINNTIDTYGTYSYPSYGINADYCANAVIEGNLIRVDGDGPQYGIRISNCSGLKIKYNLVESLSDSSSIGIHCVNSPYPEIRNNTVVTVSLSANKGISCVNAHPFITNNILVDNGEANSFGISCNSSNPTVSYNDIWNYNIPYAGCHPGEHDIYEDPLFAGGTPYDYHLQSNSPCIDSGNPNYLDPDGTRSDMGAFYFDQTSVPQSQVASIPAHHRLDANFPNPFNSETVIPFAIGQRSHVVIDIYNIIGQRIARLLEGEFDVGEHSVSWSAGYLPSGIYLCRMQAGGDTFHRKIFLLK